MNKTIIQKNIPQKNIPHLKAQIQNPLERLNENMPGQSIKAVWKEEKKVRESQQKSVCGERERGGEWKEITIGSFPPPPVMS